MVFCRMIQNIKSTKWESGTTADSLIRTHVKILYWQFKGKLCNILFFFYTVYQKENKYINSLLTLITLDIKSTTFQVTTTFSSSAAVNTYQRTKHYRDNYKEGNYFQTDRHTVGLGFGLNV